MTFIQAYQGIHIAFIDVSRIQQLGSSPFDVKLTLTSSWRVTFPGSVMLLLLLLIVVIVFFSVSCKASLLSFLDRSVRHTITRLLYADLSHLQKKNDNGRIHKENMQPHTRILIAPRVVPLATRNHSKKMRVKWLNDKVTSPEQWAHSLYQEMIEALNP